MRISLLHKFTLKFYAIKADGSGDLFPLGNYGIKENAVKLEHRDLIIFPKSPQTLFGDLMLYLAHTRYAISFQNLPW